MFNFVRYLFWLMTGAAGSFDSRVEKLPEFCGGLIWLFVSEFSVVSGRDAHLWRF